MNLIKICNKIIEYSFYALFLLVPLAFTSATSELFELNKMWLTWALTIIIGMSWFTKMIIQRKFYIQRTPIDIPIVLFLVSQIISTIFSLDFHVSMFGYYSRFNGGLLSIVSYIFLYYAFLSNLGNLGYLRRLLLISLISGLIVALWGLPSHFGYDPTCFIFRGTFDVSCWTADFMPRSRIFSTLGQPNWLAAYLAILLPITLAFLLNSSQSLNKHHEKLQIANSKMQKYNSNFKFPMYIFYFLFSILFYVDLLYSGSRSGFLGTWVAIIFFFVTYRLAQDKTKVKKSLVTVSLLLLITFIIGTPFSQLHKLTLDGIKSSFSKPNLNSSKALPTLETQNEVRSGEAGGTESGRIRNNVWPGAINAWKNNPIFGTGVETFAFAYYKYKPVGQNLTSEWNFLYNKAHNEYLNYLATTGAFGLGSYLLMIGWFLFLVFRYLFSVVSYQNLVNRFSVNQSDKQKSDKLESENRKPRTDNRTIILALLAGYISILITNFFGFSVVITNLYLFLIPAFVFVLNDMTKPGSVQSVQKSAKIETSIWQWTPIFFVSIIGLYMLIMLFRFWQADIAYALGYNLDRAGEYQKAYQGLHKAVELRGDEPVFKDELSINAAIIATSLISQLQSEKSDQATKDQTQVAASTLAQEAVNTSNEVIAKHPNNAVFWKTRVRLFYTLSQVDSRYLPRALDGIQKASLLAPQDANITYNLGVIYGQNNNIAKGIEALEKTVKLKPDYRDARYALGLFYHAASLDEKGKIVIDSLMQKKALDQMQYILTYISSQDAAAQDSIKTWGNP